jgi:hypothetical protein
MSPAKGHGIQEVGGFIFVFSGFYCRKKLLHSPRFEKPSSL